MRADDDVERFVDAQRGVYAEVLEELRAGRKASHWMWFVFPQLRGLGRSATAHYYGIAARAEACVYLAHPVLGPRLRECVALALAAPAPSARALFGTPDDVKFRSSMTLFAAVSGEALFRQALDRYFDGQPDPLTLAALGPESPA